MSKMILLTKKLIPAFSLLTALFFLCSAGYFLLNVLPNKVLAVDGCPGTDTPFYPNWPDTSIKSCTSRAENPDPSYRYSFSRCDYAAKKCVKEWCTDVDCPGTPSTCTDDVECGASTPTPPKSPTPTPTCAPVNTICGECSAESCSSGTKTCTDGCRVWTKQCSNMCTPTPTNSPTPTLTSTPTPTPSRESPVCDSLNASQTTGTPPFTVNFTGSAHGRSGNYITQYRFDFGDGTTQVTGTNYVSHTYGNSGSYQVVLTVVDNEGLTTTSDYCRVKINPQSPTVTPPPEQPKSGTATNLTFGLLLSLLSGIILREGKLIGLIKRYFA